MRSLLAMTLLVMLVVVAGPMGLLASLLTGSSGPIYALAFPAVRLFLRVAGVRIRVHGADNVSPDKTYVFVANHVSNADPPVALLATGRRVKSLAKASLFRIPVFGAVLRAAGMVAVERHDRERSVAAVDAAVELLRRGHDFLVFPEGTRSPDGRLRRLKKGPFVLAIKGEASVLPMVLQGTAEVWPRGSLGIRAGTVDVTFLPEVTTHGLGFEDRDLLLGRVQAMMATALGQADPGTGDLQ